MYSFFFQDYIQPLHEMASEKRTSCVFSWRKKIQLENCTRVVNNRPCVQNLCCKCLECGAPVLSHIYARSFSLLFEIYLQFYFLVVAFELRVCVFALVVAPSLFPFSLARVGVSELIFITVNKSSLDQARHITLVSVNCAQRLQIALPSTTTPRNDSRCSWNFSANIPTSPLRTVHIICCWFLVWKRREKQRLLYSVAANVCYDCKVWISYCFCDVIHALA